MEKRSMARGERPYRSKLKPYIAGHVCSVYAALQSQEACEHLLWHVHMYTIASEKRLSHAYKTSSEPAPCIAPRHVCPDIINSHQSSLQAGQLRIAQTRHNQLNPILLTRSCWFVDCSSYIYRRRSKQAWKRQQHFSRFPACTSATSRDCIMFVLVYRFSAGEHCPAGEKAGCMF